MTNNDFTIDPTNVDKDPIQQFDTWYQRHLQVSQPEASAMVLSTTDNEGNPDGRIVLLKSYDQSGFVFFTNYQSAKAQHLETCPRACLVFYFPEDSRQIRVFGTVEKVSSEESDSYFATRPFESQLGAWASLQSQRIAQRSELNEKMAKLREKYSKNQRVPRPPQWGGYRVSPTRVEFWQGRDNRIHDRVEYILEDKLWTRHRLSP